MYWTRKRAWIAVIAVVAVALGGCPSDPAEDPLDAEWAAVQEDKATLDAKRQELAELEAKAAEPVEVEAPAKGEEAVEPVDYTPQLEALRDETTQLGEAFVTRVVAFLNSDPMVQGEEPTQRQLAALRLKSSEDMLLAEEWIEKGGDYARAVTIFNNALGVDPDNPDLQAGLAKAEAMRYMSEERFAAASKDMTDEEVRQTLGTPLRYNVQTYEDRGVTAWLYPKSDDGAAAAVYFKADKGGQLVAYQLNYDAVPARSDKQ